MRSDSARAADMREAIERIRGWSVAGRAEFLADDRTRGAVAFEVLKLGEAAARVSAEYRRAHPTVPWTRLTAMRDRIVHEYFRVDDESLWEFVEHELGPLDRALRAR